MSCLKKLTQGGQTLIALLAFMATALTLTSAATIVVVTNAQGTSKYAIGQEALSVAEVGVDNAMLRLIRDPSYTGETLAVGAGTATISVSGSSVKTITSVGKSGDSRRTVQASAVWLNNVLTLSSWSETP